MKALSLRLKTIAALVPVGARACDIGTDHGYLSIYLRKQNIAKTVIACDLNQKPLDTAKKNIEKLNADNITLRLCDGLHGIKRDEIDTVIIAGMGGNVISDILSRCPFDLDKDITFILQPTTSAEVLREFLCKNGFEIVSETPVFENEKLYSVMLVKYSGVIPEKDIGFYYIGKLDKHNPVGLQYIEKQEKRLFKALKATESIPEKRDDYINFLKAYSYIKNYLSE